MHDGKAGCGSILDNKLLVPAQPTSAVLAWCPARRATTLTLLLHPAVIDMASNTGVTGSRIKRPNDVLVQQLLLINAATAGWCRQPMSLQRWQRPLSHQQQKCKHSFTMFIFFSTMTPIRIRLSKGPAHGRHASACKSLLPSVERFGRR